MQWLKTLLKKLFSSSIDKTIDNVVIWYDDVDVILYKKPKVR